MTDELETKIVFLDIDGVLNSSLSLYAGCNNNKWSIDKNIVSAYKKFSEKHNLKTVIISSWREKVKNTQEMEKIIFDDCGIHLNIHDLTPVLNKKRGFEVESYIRNNNIKNYVIIDDQANFLDNQLDRFIKTDIALGMTIYNFKEIAEKLNIIDLELKFL